MTFRFDYRPSCEAELASDPDMGAHIARLTPARRAGCQIVGAVRSDRALPVVDQSRPLADDGRRVHGGLRVR